MKRDLRTAAGPCVWLLTLLAPLCAWGEGAVHTVPYLPSASSEVPAGVVRVESRSAVSGKVGVVAVDDAGQRYEAGTLALGARTAVELDVGALEAGDVSLGLAGTGSGEGDWRLELTTELDIEARAYARSKGLLTALHDAVLVSDEVEMPLFHPGGDARRSVLRLANAGDETVALRVWGIDDAGRWAGPVTAELGPREARSYAASELESGSAAGLSGSLGDGEGKWRLRLSAETGSAYATNLLLDGSGVLSSVPAGMSRGAGIAHRVPLFPSAADTKGRRGLVRVVNRSASVAEVLIEPVNETDRAYQRLRLSLAAEASSEFDSMDLEHGGAEKGLAGSAGSGEGDWWLELASGSDIEVLSYVEAAGGPLSAVRGASGVETANGMHYETALLWGESGELWLLNAGAEIVKARVSGTDDAGASGGPAEFELDPWGLRKLTREALEDGGVGIRGALGAATGSWRLSLEADGEIDVLSLVLRTDGALSDVSRRGRPAGAPPRTEVVDAAVRARADLWISVRSSEAALSPGEAFELRVTVGNRGGLQAPATTLRYYRSTDATITTSDTSVGTNVVATLGASSSSAESIDLTAPSEPGTYYYGACVDAVAEESDTANNCSRAVVVTVAEPSERLQPDLAVSASVRGSPQPGGSFVLEASLHNLGAGAAPATTLRYYRSTDATITTSDTSVGTNVVATLGASSSSAESIDLTAPSEPGTYYYGACVDAVAEESDTANNCSRAVVVTVAEPSERLQPDLAVSASVRGSPQPGGSFVLEASLHNLGAGAAPATTLRYYRSADETITMSDTSVGRDAVASLGASGGSAESINLTAPSVAGTYYYGACVDAVAEESDTTNNCSASVAVTVGETTYPDLVADTPTVNKSSPEAGAEFTLTATVTNRSNGHAKATTLRFYRSTDATISTSDLEVDTDSVAELAASGSSGHSVTVIAPSTAGTYYYGACVDPVANELDVNNNCSPSVALQVARRAPDLSMGRVTVSDSNPAPGAPMRVFATVRNIGNRVAESTTLRYLRSTDAEITTSDTQEGTDVVFEIDARSSTFVGETFTAPSTLGVHYYGACVDAVADESDTANNCSAAVEVSVQEPPSPDLVVETPSVNESSPETGAEFTLSATVTNQGDANAEATTLRFYRSADATITSDDASLDTAPVAALVAAGRSGHSVSVTALSTAGTYYYGACVDAVADESDGANNCSAAVEVSVQEPPSPDLVVETPSVNESSPETGAEFTLSATVTNQGDANAEATTLRFYRSTDATITSDDASLDTAPVAALVAAGRSGHSVSVTALSTAGTYYYGACVDAVADESDGANNCSAAVEVSVQEPPSPDLVVDTSTVNESSPEAGAEFTLSATVTNQGDANAEATTLRFYRSTDATITRDDASLDTAPVAALAVSGNSDQSTRLSAPTTPGTYYLGACVDVVSNESDTTNNCSPAVKIGVTPKCWPNCAAITYGTGQASCRGGLKKALFVGADTKQEAIDGAFQACLDEGIDEYWCRVTVTPFTECVALKFTPGSLACSFDHGLGRTRAEAEDNADPTGYCRSPTSSCKIVYGYCIAEGG